ncbi:MAG: thioredoxin family protein [Proteobacteria bacterium]|nr:thioredoxin family protein [Pseudomonadota bacterium]
MQLPSCMVKVLKNTLFFFTFFSPVLSASDYSEHWITKNIDIELTAAKAVGKPAIIYWGAEWCPPCNAMKAEVFGSPEFLKATSSMLRIMIDGDGKDAQKWSDHFKATGYPTIILLNSSSEQILRFVGFVPKETVLAAIETVSQSQISVFKLLEAISKGEQINDAQLRVLALSDWGSNKDELINGKETLDIALTVFQKLPETASIEKSQISQFILYKASISEKISNALKSDLEKKYPDLVKALVASESAKRNSIPFFASSGEIIKAFIGKDVPLAEQKMRVAVWQEAVFSVESAMDDSLTDAVNFTSAKAIIQKFQPNNPVVIKKIKTELDVLSKQMQKVKDQFLLTSLVPSLADAYESIGEIETAKRLLRTTAKRSNVPNYFLGHLAYFVEQGGNINESVRIREEAVRVARGHSTKIQWTWSYVKAIQKSTLPRKDVLTDNALISLVEIALSEPDGFDGRNSRYLEQAQALMITRVKDSGKLAKFVTRSRPFCDDSNRKFKSDNFDSKCKSFFEKIAIPADSKISKKQTQPSEG